MATRTLQIAGCKKKHSVCISLVNDLYIKKLNKLYRGKNKPTDVLSFSAPKEVPSLKDFLGDVIISVQTAKKNAKAEGVSLKEEFVRLTVHGLLHLLGYDHEAGVEKNKAQKMMKLQEKVIHKIIVEL